MRRIALLAIASGFLAPLLASAPASAQATRTWVSGVGDDVNPCSRTAPCKTFAGAISKTASGGEINCLDPGGFGGVTTIKPITFNCKYTIGSILVQGTPGITINTAGATDRVTIRGIQIQGINQTPTPGTIGVRILAANSVSIEDSVITGMGQQGIADQRTAGNTKLFIRNTVISNNSSSGISLTATGPNKVDLSNVSSINNLFGVATGTGNNVMAKHSVFSGNGTGVQADPGGVVAVDSSQITANTTGINANGTVRYSNTDVTFNNTGFAGTATSFGNNRLLGNGVLGAGSGAAGAASTDLGQQ
jgi:hypothetical protein